MFSFEQVDTVKDYKEAFSRVHLNRQMSDYKLVLDWCNIFLSSQCVTPFKGTKISFALFFDMNKIFEAYVAFCLRRDNPSDLIQTQVGLKYLIESTIKKF